MCYYWSSVIKVCLNATSRSITHKVWPVQIECSCHSARNYGWERLSDFTLCLQWCFMKRGPNTVLLPQVNLGMCSLSSQQGRPPQQTASHSLRQHISISLLTGRWVVRLLGSQAQSDVQTSICAATLLCVFCWRLRKEEKKNSLSEPQ